MKKHPSLFLTLFGALVCATAAHAQLPTTQQTPSPLPPGPLILKRAPEMAMWTVTTTIGPLKDPAATRAGQPAPQNDAEASSQAVSKMLFCKTGSIVLVERFGEGKQVWNTWCRGPLQVVTWPDGKNCAEATVPTTPRVENPFYNDFSVSDFRGFEWVAKENYIGIADFGGMKCIVYQKTLTIPSDSGDLPQYVPALAYVDVSSRLPIALVMGEQSSLFEWKSPPQSMLILPPNVQALLNQRQKGLDQMSQQALKPF